MDKKFSGRTSGPSSRSWSAVLCGAVRRTRALDGKQHEQTRPSLGEGQLQQPAPRGRGMYACKWLHSTRLLPTRFEAGCANTASILHGLFVLWQGCGSPSIPMPTAAFPARIDSSVDPLHTAAILTLGSYRGQRGCLRRVATLAPVAGVQEAACERAGFPACLALQSFQTAVGHIQTMRRLRQQRVSPRRRQGLPVLFCLRTVTV